MAITALTGSTDQQTGTSPWTFSHTCHSSATILFIAVSFNNSQTPTSASVTWNGHAMTVVHFTDAGDYCSHGLWYIASSDTGANDFVVTYSGGIATQVCAAAFESFSGGTTVDAPASSSGSSGNLTTTAISSATGDLVVASGGSDDTALGSDGSQTELQYVDDASGASVSLCSKAGAASVTLTWTGGSYAWAAGGLNVNVPAGPTIEQEGFRFRNDDGTEATATGKANQDVNITLAADTAFRLRFLLKATGNPDSINAQAEARVKPSGGAFGAWEKIN